MTDPEIPVISIADLGVLRDVTVEGDMVTATITPTYSGCPAMDAIRVALERALYEAGFATVRVKTALSPAWTTDWITPAGRKALRDFGIAPPSGHAPAGPMPLSLNVRCPQCDSLDTQELSRFGSTSCKALWRCNDCLEPFDYFKVL